MLTHRFENSTAIASVRYNPETHQMDVTFTSGRTYTHDNVPVSVYEELVAAGSPGRHYVQNIKGTY
jgi:KTSC domain